MGNTLMGNGFHIPSGAHSVVVLLNLWECQCERSLMTGARREELLGLLRQAVEKAYFGVTDSDAMAFGNNVEERNAHGPTLSLTLDDSGITFDNYPEVGTVQVNLHYCNIRNNNDHKIDACVENILAVLQPRHSRRHPPIKMEIHYKDFQKAMADAYVPFV